MAKPAKTLGALIEDARAEIEEMDPDELAELLAEDPHALVVDVREPYEYERGHIPGALLVPRGMLEGAADQHNRHTLAELAEARARTVILVCDTGARSALATVTLTMMGFERVINLKGGMVMWEAEDHALSMDPPAHPLP